MKGDNNLVLYQGANVAWQNAKQAQKLAHAIATGKITANTLQLAFTMGFMSGGTFAGQIGAAIQEQLGGERDKALAELFGPEEKPKAPPRPAEEGNPNAQGNHPTPQDPRGQVLPGT